MTKHCTKKYIALLFLAASVITVAGCYSASRPSDAEVLQAIDASGAFKGQGVTLTSPITIVERGVKDDYGFWHYKVTMTLVARKLNGEMSEPRQNTVTFKIKRSKDSAGKSVWVASL